MEQEKELLHGQTSWLNGELKAKSEELLSLSRQKGNQILELKCKLENKEDEVCLFLCIYIKMFIKLKDVEKNSYDVATNTVITIA